jgi:histidinol-phosphatase (PHP family)
MVESAIEKGVSVLGLLVHSYLEFDEEYSVNPKDVPEFVDTVAALKKEYEGKIKILCGAEVDYYAKDVGTFYDYIIASAHYIRRGDKYYPVDASPESFTDMVDKLYDGDFYAAAEEYYSLVGSLGDVTSPTLIGHFDLFTKFNEGDCLFDTSNPRYVKAWQGAADKLLKLGVPFEINTGAIARGYRTEPYPSRQIRDYLRAGGAKLVLSSDAHSAANVAFRFPEFEKCLFE